MSIKELLNSNTNVCITVGILELKEFALEVADEVINQYHKINKSEKYLTPNELCEYLNVDRSTLWRWAKQGYLVPTEVGGKRLYKQSDIDKLFSGKGA